MKYVKIIAEGEVSELFDLQDHYVSLRTRHSPPYVIYNFLLELLVY